MYMKFYRIKMNPQGQQLLGGCLRVGRVDAWGGIVVTDMSMLWALGVFAHAAPWLRARFQDLWFTV